MTDEVGRVIGTKESQPLEFWVGVKDDQYVQLDEVLAVTTKLPAALPDGRDEVDHYGVVDIVQSAYEGASYHSDVFREADGLMPVGVSTIAHVAVTRVEPEIFVPPRPGRWARRASEQDRETALYFKEMHNRFLLGFSRDGKKTWGNLDFLDGSSGAHVNISGVSGVATKTSYALFLLYGLFELLPSPLGTKAASSHAIIFNVKGEDLLWLDKSNTKLSEEDRDMYEAMGATRSPQPFRSVTIWKPSGALGRRADAKTYTWSLRDFCKEKLLEFLFAEADDETTRLSHVIRRVSQKFAEWADIQENDWPALQGPNGATFDSLRSLSNYVSNSTPKAFDLEEHPQTWQAFTRRLDRAAELAGSLIQPISPSDASEQRIEWTKGQINVIDIYGLPDTAKRFVVGVVTRNLLAGKGLKGELRPDLVFLVLDELNKYAPREGWSPIKETILDIAERGRSLGVVLLGAQQTASEIERRVIANASFRVVGRLDSAEAQRGEYRFLRDSQIPRALVLKPGSLFVQQPEIPMPLMVRFPRPAGATRESESEEPAVLPRGFAR